MEPYDPQQIERRWQTVWADEGTWEVPNPGQPTFDETKPKSYVLVMLPYPSGEPHVGHLKVYAIGDAIAHYKRRNGYSETEIAQKREALENVLIPYKLLENRQLLLRSGFRYVDVFFKWYNFCGIVAIK